MDILSTNHWSIESYRQVVTKKEAQEILRNRFHLVNGRLREFKAKHIGVEMYEISKLPLKE